MNNNIMLFYSNIAFVILLLLITPVTLLYISKLKKDRKKAEKNLSEFEEYYKQKRREEWFKNLSKMNYSNEVEVEVKFVYPLVKVLGYDDHDISLRFPVRLHVGSKAVSIQADWVLWRKDKSSNRRAAAVIEVKASDQSLDESVTAQARSYAFGLNAPVYFLTNGRILRVFLRGVERDELVIDCEVSRLAEVWPTLYQVIGANSSEDPTTLSKILKLKSRVRLFKKPRNSAPAT